MHHFFFFLLFFFLDAVAVVESLSDYSVVAAGFVSTSGFASSFAGAAFSSDFVYFLLSSF